MATYPQGIDEGTAPRAAIARQLVAAGYSHRDPGCGAVGITRRSAGTHDARGCGGAEIEVTTPDDCATECSSRRGSRRWRNGPIDDAVIAVPAALWRDLTIKR